MTLQCHVTVTMPRVTHRNLTRGITFFFQKILEKIKNKIKKTID